MDADARREIDRLRDRSHDLGNQTQTLIAEVGALSGKMDAIHISLKEDLAAIRNETEKTNGRVTQHERDLAIIKGMWLALTAGLPFVLFALDRLVH